MVNRKSSLETSETKLNFTHKDDFQNLKFSESFDAKNTLVGEFLTQLSAIEINLTLKDQKITPEFSFISFKTSKNHLYLIIYKTFEFGCRCFQTSFGILYKKKTPS